MLICKIYIYPYIYIYIYTLDDNVSITCNIEVKSDGFSKENLNEREDHKVRISFCSSYLSRLLF